MTTGPSEHSGKAVLIALASGLGLPWLAASHAAVDTLVLMTMTIDGLTGVGYRKYTFGMERTTLSLKVSKPFVARFRRFCDDHALSVGKFAEQQLAEVMEDYHFGRQAQRVLSRGDARRATLRDVSRRRG